MMMMLTSTWTDLYLLCKLMTYLAHVCFYAVYSQLPVQKLSGYSYELADDEFDRCAFLPEPRPGIRPFDSSPFYFQENDQKNDVYNIFKGIGIKIVTNSDIRKT
ncbi:hypothetical protein CesoFtcFv8_007332 [Champsocephalus esox]|uniref:Uncharacterized protein n=1 Tax=Champsocephalus esox TaxID=159716 RepID=A0AAN8H4S3_9TELE|nr:hypothetical protein CesoFtcFv8_007332 [Champsocephalus esox]